MPNEEKQTKEGYKVLDPSEIIIPRCCREGLDSCPHVPKKQKQIKRNIGL